ncbi:hypothetical protein AB0G02_23605 [Actinosynnema sp. NPDC023658]|uniref:hypothetical protein n=1 Tax=Actinosynnema sp. NPDC023658 TaxID=3155465 RepID=UPI0033D31AE7
MTTETEQHPTWGEEPPPQAAAAGNGWNGRKSLAAVAIAVGIAAVGGGVIYAASNSDAAQRMGGPGGYHMRGGPGGLVIMGGPFGDSLHGAFQKGEVTGVTDSSITVKSTDGFDRTYLIDDGTEVNGGQGHLDDITEGDTVTVVASSDGDEQPTADTIMEGDVQRGGPQQRQDGKPPVNGQQGTPPTR